MAVQKKSAAKRPAGNAAPKAPKAAKVGGAGKAPAASAKKGRGGLYVTLALIAALGGLGVQAFYVARQKAAMKFDFIRTGSIIPQGLADGQGTGPTALAGDSEGNIFFLDGAERSDMRLQKFDKNEKFVGKYKPTRGEQVLGKAMDLAVDAEGGVYVLRSDGTILEMDNDLRFKAAVPVKVSDPSAMAVSDDGRIFVASRGDNKIQVFGNDGHVITEFGAAKTQSGDIATPIRLCFDAAGDLAVLEDLPESPRLKLFDKDLKMVRSFRLLGVSMCPPLRLGADDKGRLFINDFSGNTGILIYRLDKGKQIGQVKGTSQGDLFVSPGSVGVNRFTGAILVHTIPGLIPCTMPVGH